MTDPIPTAKVDAADRERIAAGLLLLVNPADALEAAIARIAYLEERNDELQQDVARLTSDLGQARETISALTSSRARHLGERNDARAEADRLAALLDDAEESAEKQRQAACNLRDTLGRVAASVAVADVDGPTAADRIIAAIGALSDERDQARCAERDNAHQHERLLDAAIDKVAAVAGVGSGSAQDVSDEVVTRIRRLVNERDAARAEGDRLAALLTAAEADAEALRRGACKLRDALDRVATAAGVADGSGDEVADRIVAAIDKLRESVARHKTAAGPAESVHAALGVSSREAAIAAIANGVPCPTCGATKALATAEPPPRPSTCPKHGDTVKCYCTTGIAHCGVDDCGYTPPFCEACFDYHDAPACLDNTDADPDARGPIGGGSIIAVECDDLAAVSLVTDGARWGVRMDDGGDVRWLATEDEARRSFAEHVAADRALDRPIGGGR